MSNDINDTNAANEAKINILKDALHFYSDKEIYDNNLFIARGDGTDDISCEIFEDNGRKARDALSETTPATTHESQIPLRKYTDEYGTTIYTDDKPVNDTDESQITELKEQNYLKDCRLKDLGQSLAVDTVTISKLRSELALKEMDVLSLKEQLAKAEGRNKMLEEDLVIIGNLLDSERERCRRLGDSLLNRICESLESPSDTAGSEGHGVEDA